MEGSSFSETAALAALNRIFGYMPQVGLALCNYAGSALDVFSLPPEEKEKALSRYPGIAERLTAETLEKEELELERIRKAGARFIGMDEEDYPSALLECPDHPLGLYFKGGSSPEEVFGIRPSIAVVGTRNLTPYGREWTAKIVRAMAETPSRPLIVSGLAFGADYIAHDSALKNGLPSVGVMATGIDKIYPWQHQDLARKLCSESGCAIVTDYPPGTAPVALNFMRRNRIIAGLCFATIVIESAIKGGSLITARYAVDYSRDVYALPGKLGDVRSEGCIYLIEKKMADIISGTDSLIGKLSLGAPARRKPSDALHSAAVQYRMDPDAKKLLAVLEAVKEARILPMEELALRTGLPYGEAAGLAATLEADGFLETDLLQRCSINLKFH